MIKQLELSAVKCKNVRCQPCIMYRWENPAFWDIQKPFYKPDKRVCCIFRQTCSNPKLLCKV